MAIKHIGRVKSSKKKCIVAFRTIPDDPYSCLIIPTETLPADEHDSLMKTVESPSAQQAFELYEVLQRSYFPDGRSMLASLHLTGQLRKMATNEIIMTPDMNNTVMLDELNKMIADQKGVSLDDLAVQSSAAKPTKTQPAESMEVVEDATDVGQINATLSDEDLAAQYRSQADTLFKEAKALREQAEQLVPTKKKTKKTTESA